MVACVVYPVDKGERIMLRTICPFCNKEVLNKDKEDYVINGRGLFKTKSLYHLKCYDDFVTHKMNSALFREVLNENK